MTDNQRQHDRHAIREIVRWRLIDFNSLNSTYLTETPPGGIGLDISLGGMFISTREPHPMGSIIELVYWSDEASAETRAYAKVMRVMTDGTRHGMGVELLEVSRDNARELLQKAQKGPWVEQSS